MLNTRSYQQQTNTQVGHQTNSVIFAKLDVNTNIDLMPITTLNVAVETVVGIELC